MQTRSAQSTSNHLILMADLDRLARAECYEHLGRELRAIGEIELADIFDGLATGSFELLPDHLREARRSAFLASHAGDGEIRCDATACHTAYDAWAAAVDMERDAAAKLITLLSQAEDPRVKLLLLGRIRECFRRKADHRLHRRAAYHSEKIGAIRAAFPDIRRIQDANDLALVALAIEQWFLRLLEMKTGTSGSYLAASEMTRAAILRLEALTRGHAVPRRLSKWLDALAKLPGASDAASCSARFLQLKLVAEGSRVFDYYDRIFEAAGDLAMLSRAQSLSADALARLKALRAANPG